MTCCFKGGSILKLLKQSINLISYNFLCTVALLSLGEKRYQRFYRDYFPFRRYQTCFMFNLKPQLIKKSVRRRSFLLCKVCKTSKRWRLFIMQPVSGNPRKEPFIIISGDAIHYAVINVMEEMYHAYL